MLSVRIDADLSGATKIIERLRRDSPVHLAKALTFTAERVRDGLKAEIGRVFDSPVPFTLNALRLKTATVQTLSAEVKVKDEAGKGTRPIHFLAPHIYGGNRNQKRFEVSLEGANLLPPGWVAVPGDAVKLDANGNVPASVYVRILSQLRVQIKSGFESRIGGLEGSRKKIEKTVNRQGGRFFVGRPGKGRLPLGIWFRQYVSGPNVSIVSPMFLFVNKAKYRKRYDFFGLGQRLVDIHFPQQAERQLNKLINSFGKQ